MTQITELTAADEPAWDGYVESHPLGLPQHLAGWQRILQQSYGYATPFLLARQDTQIVGVMPLFIVRSPLLGTTAMTTPGGLCADDETAAAALIDRARAIARQAGAGRLILHDSRRDWEAGLQTTTHHVHWEVELADDVETMWSRVGNSIRRQVRLARRNELRVEIDRSGDSLPAFYEVFRRFTHELGTPVFGRHFLEQVISHLPDHFTIVVVYRGHEPIGGYIQLLLGQTVYGTWGASLRDYLKLRPTYLAHWSIMEDAVRHGYRCLDMGRSPTGSNASNYKRQWGGLSQPIYQQVSSLRSDAPAESIIDRTQSDGTFGLVRRLWPRLPLPVAQFLGPKLRRHLPFA